LAKSTAAPGPTRSPNAEGPDLPALIQEFEADSEQVMHFYDLPWSEQRSERMNQLLHQWQQRLLSLNFDGLDQPGRIDYLLLRNKLEAEHARFGLDQSRLEQMQELLPFRATVQKLQQARWRREPMDARAAASALSTLPEDIKKLRKRLEKEKKPGDKARPESEPEKEDKPQPKAEEPSTEGVVSGKLTVSAVVARRAATAVEELRRVLKDWATFYEGFVPDFNWWLKKPAADAQTALEGYTKFLREELAGLKGEDDDPLVGDPIGAEALKGALAAEMLPYSPEELIAIGETEFAWCEAQMKEAARAMQLGEDWKAALARVKESYVPPGKQDEVIAAKARGAIDFVKQRDLVTVPPLAEELWRLSMLSPEAQKNLPYAAYSGPNMLVAYARDDMKHDDKMMSMRGNNPHFMHIVTPHELIPGHHLQRFMSDRHRPYRHLFSTPFYVEGWSLYWEFMLWDKGYGATPEDRVGMLFWRMHRAARIIVSLKFHLGQMTPKEMADFIVERVGHERSGAMSEVRRFIGGNYSPLYQCGYMIGGLQLRALRQEVLALGRLTEKQFHDAVLASGPIPIEFVRAGLLERPLTRESRAAWRFAAGAPGQ
jgi:uncharacterized protein (DUF885 family)